MTNNEGLSYSTHRAYSSIGETSQKTLEDHIRKVANFAVLAQNRQDWPVLEINIESYALRRKLSQELAAIYKDRNMIFTSFAKASPVFTVRKYKAGEKDRGNEKDDKNGGKPKEVKVQLDEFE